MAVSRANRVVLAAVAAALLGVVIAVALVVAGRSPERQQAESSGPPDFGPDVTILDPSMDAETIQRRVDEIFAAQQTNQFGERRDAVLFAPGEYDVTVDVGFNTSVLGLGLSPDDVTVNGQVRVDAEWFDGNATQNFWRSVENLAIAPADGVNRWAVAQAAPMRRVHVRGGLDVYPSGSWPSILERRLYRRLENRRPGGIRLPAAVVLARQRVRKLGRVVVEHGLLRRARRAAADLPEPALHRARRHSRVA